MRRYANDGEKKRPLSTPGRTNYVHKCDLGKIPRPEVSRDMFLTGEERIEGFVEAVYLDLRAELLP
jgi:hypothetical protein